MHINELIRLHGDRLRGMSHGAYAELARAACGDSPAVSASIRADKIDPERRFSNIIRTAVLRHLDAGSPPHVVTRALVVTRLIGFQSDPRAYPRTDRRGGAKRSVRSGVPLRS